MPQILIQQQKTKVTYRDDKEFVMMFHNVIEKTELETHNAVARLADNKVHK